MLRAIFKTFCDWVLDWFKSDKTRELEANDAQYKVVKERYDASFFPRFFDPTPPAKDAEPSDDAKRNLLFDDLIVEAIGTALKNNNLHKIPFDSEWHIDFFDMLHSFGRDLIKDNNTFFLIPPDSWSDDLIGRYSVRQYLTDFSALLDVGTPAIEQWQRTLCDLYTLYLGALPHKTLLNIDAAHPLAYMPIASQIHDLPALIDDLVTNVTLLNQPLLFGVTAHRFRNNMEYAAQLQQASKEKPTHLYPRDYLQNKTEQPDIVDVYLLGTPFQRLFAIELPITLSQETRFAHHWIVAPPGTGKTTTLQNLINSDLDLVAQGKASVIVMESNRDLIKSIEGLKRFGKGGDLEGKLILIDAEDVEYPVALNLFDLGLDTFAHFPLRDQQALQNAATSLLDYIFRALLGAELTSKQSTMFTFATQLLIQIPDATLDTFLDLMQPRAQERYAPYVAKLKRVAREYFRLKFDTDPQLQATKSQVVDRIFAIKRIDAISNMFSAPKTKLDLFAEMGSAKVILINAFNQLLQEDGVVFQPC